MTEIGKACLIILGVLSAAGLLLSWLAQTRGPSQSRRERRDSSTKVGARMPEMPGEPVLFRTAEARFINCKAQTVMDPGAVEIYGERAARLERECLAYSLADQLLAAGGIAFRKDGNVLRAELRAVMPE